MSNINLNKTFKSLKNKTNFWILNFETSFGFCIIAFVVWDFRFVVLSYVKAIY